ncbi:DUF6174 domain-containing protein [Streptomyces sp. NPDC096205]|uniref:DUF6174 domain-containing protein n=1 Tax=Streptomyces sp. NPDC096205 TaxID=3366081 RepID=UPI0037FE4A34
MIEGTITMSTSMTTTVTAVRRTRGRAVAAVALIAGMLGATAACGTETEAASPTGSEAVAAQSRTTWKEPASYVYTLESTEGERALIGTFRITVRDHEVTRARGLDESGRRVVKAFPDQVPTIGALLGELEQARSEDADKAEASYAPDGHPERIVLDWDTNALDDESHYVISGYAPGS